jgi:hypothetical protein
MAQCPPYWGRYFSGSAAKALRLSSLEKYQTVPAYFAADRLFLYEVGDRIVTLNGYAVFRAADPGAGQRLRTAQHGRNEECDSQTAQHRIGNRRPQTKKHRNLSSRSHSVRRGVRRT